MDVEVRISRALIDASICCPAPDCGMHCRCTGWIPGECAIFECRCCERRWYVGLGASPVLRVEPVVEQVVA